MYPRFSNLEIMSPTSPRCGDVSLDRVSSHCSGHTWTPSGLIAMKLLRELEVFLVGLQCRNHTFARPQTCWKLFVLALSQFYAAAPELDNPESLH